MASSDVRSCQSQLRRCVWRTARNRDMCDVVASARGGGVLVRCLQFEVPWCAAATDVCRQPVRRTQTCWSRHGQSGHAQFTCSERGATDGWCCAHNVFALDVDTPSGPVTCLRGSEGTTLRAIFSSTRCGVVLRVNGAGKGGEVRRLRPNCAVNRPSTALLQRIKCTAWAPFRPELHA